MKIVSQDLNIKSGFEELLNYPKNDFSNIHFIIKIYPRPTMNEVIYKLFWKLISNK